MIAWYWSVVAFIGGIVFATVTWEVCDYTNWLSSLLAGLTLVVVFIPCMFYQIFIKHIIFPVPENKWEFLTTSKAFENRKKYHLFKNFYFWYSPNGSFHDKFFFVRVKKSKVKKK